MTPYYEHGGIAIYHGDCRDVLPYLAVSDVVLTDPPYGIDLDTDNTRFSGGSAGSVSKRGGGVRAKVHGDSAPVDPSFILPFGRDHIVWGWNHFPDKFPRGACLVWLKRNDDAFQTFLSDAEVAWMSKGHGVYCRRDLSNQGITNTRVHPTQKPLSLMRWCLSFAPLARTVLDPFMGSGTTLRAAKDAGLSAVGIEIDEYYCEVAARRLSQEVLDFAPLSDAVDPVDGVVADGPRAKENLDV
jgi:hypothetical protein